MKNIIVGTAGHIDHGKTTLVKALTGIDTDRLKEEKERGISIDLGFANLKTAQGARIAFIDVPGHERFVRNMLAGVSGIDLVLFVVAADEAIKPQTREHFDICRLLGIERGVIALTKADLVEADWLELVRMEMEDFVRGSFLEGAAIVPVSATTGMGLEDLLKAITAAAVGMEQRDLKRMPRLAIDRAFVMKGHGTVVTGTLKEGRLAVESEVELYPSGRVARVRGIQVHGETVKEAQAGQRTAVNLAGVEVGDVVRGYVAAPPGKLSPVRIFDAQIDLLPGAKLIRDRAQVHFHAGTMEVAAELRVLDEKRTIEPGNKAWVRLVLEEETLVLPGDRFILRSFSPVVTIAGGTVMELHYGATRMKRKGAVERLTRWKGLDLAGRIGILLEERPLGMEFGDLRRRLGCLESDVPEGLERIGSWVASGANLKKIAVELVQRLRQHHKDFPLEAGLSREALRSGLLAGAPAGLMEALLRQAPSVKAEGDLLRLESHKVKLEAKEDEASQAMEAAFLQAGLAVPAVDDVLASTGLAAARAKAVLGLLLREGKLVRVGPELVYHREALGLLKKIFAERKGQRFGVVEFKDWTGVSRKYAIPLLEFLDREKITRRDGDQRLIL
ncbi:MAG: selenocysteine-specific translation elongation factor [Acidobacteria bacterium]|nr:selenocysteine-specific translation elongation factor [Acidobacteriota bacterium]